MLSVTNTERRNFKFIYYLKIKSILLKTDKFISMEVTEIIQKTLIPNFWIAYTQFTYRYETINSNIKATQKLYSYFWQATLYFRYFSMALL